MANPLMYDEGERIIEEFYLEFPKEEKPGRRRLLRFYGAIYDWVDSVVGAIFLIFLIFTFLFRVVGVSGSSMIPTLKNGDWVAVSALSNGFKRGDIVVVTQPNDVHEPLIKRVIAIGGDEIDIDFKKHTVSINGIILDEPYIASPTERYFDVKFPLKVPPGKVFVMGDNRNNSKDSRASGVGMIDERYILGKTLIRIYPPGGLKIKYASYDLQKQLQVK